MFSLYWNYIHLCIYLFISMENQVKFLVNEQGYLKPVFILEIVVF